MSSLPNLPNVPQGQLDKLYRALGEGMVRSQYIETALYLAALGSMNGRHDECSAAFFKRTGIGGRLKFTDESVRAVLSPEIYERDWKPILSDAETFVKFRNSLAHFEVYHLSDADRAQGDNPTAFNVIISVSHMNAQARKETKAPALTIEMIDTTTAKSPRCIICSCISRLTTSRPKSSSAKDFCRLPRANWRRTGATLDRHNSSAPKANPARQALGKA
jgi:hypothetical protein